MSLISRLRRKKGWRKKKLTYKVPTASEKINTYFNNPKFFDLMIKEVKDEVRNSGYDPVEVPHIANDIAMGVITRKFGFNKIFRELQMKGIRPDLVNMEMTGFSNLLATKVITEEAKSQGIKTIGDEEINKMLKLQMEKIKLITDIAEEKIDIIEARKKIEEINRELKKANEKFIKENEKIMNEEIKNKIKETLGMKTKKKDDFLSMFG